MTLMHPAMAQQLSAAPDQVVYQLIATDIDPAIRDFTEDNLVIFNRSTPASAPLAVFLPGTGGSPRELPIFNLIANQGYRVLVLQYNNGIAASAGCAHDPDANCTELFRRDRIYGTPASPHSVMPPAETILHRLTATLTLLDRQHPGEGWGGYLAAGQPNWGRIAVSGLSQGAGMAAMIAKDYPVARAVLFSAPGDFIRLGGGRGTTPAPWLATPNATPPERWFAEYHARERGAERLSLAYAALRIPPNHIFVFNLDLQPGAQAKGDNPFHPSTIRNPGYLPQWQAMFGTAAR